MKRSLPLIIIALVALAALSGGFLFYRAKLAQLNSASAGPATGDDSLAKAEHVRGSATAPVTLEEFGDFQCPPCATLATSLEKIEQDYGAKVRVVFHHFPLEVHQHATLAARTAEAAGLQGHFWPMHDLLFHNRDTWSAMADVMAEFKTYATSLGLNVDRLRSDIDSPAVRERVEKDQDLGKSRNVSATPTVFINGTLLPLGSFSDPGLRAAIDAALKGEPLANAVTPSPTPPQP
ncbi:MAG: DsbA family protein [Chthoniobacterales bacterium]